jgi:peptide/nickel transport system permease protein
VATVDDDAVVGDALTAPLPPDRSTSWRFRPAEGSLLARRFGITAGRRGLWLGVGLLAALLVASLALPVTGLPHPDAQDLSVTLSAPSASHPFGTDELGRDVLSRTLSAAKLDLSLAFAVTAASLLIGTTVGVLAGFLGRRVDALCMRLADVALAFPVLVLMLALAAILGPGMTAFFVGVPLVGWATYARLTRAQMLVVREQDYISAARTLGYSRRRILLLHAAPNVWKPALTYSMSDAILNIILLATLSYLGAGIQPPRAEWGDVIADGQQFLLQAWWISTLPGLVLVLVGIALSLVGDGLSDVLDRQDGERT